ncbi:MAG: transporter substrate-binding domain-containing protein [Lachnospiraceae bacterium]|nr:transporter substrate-binding domain-containing protein [Lachnospiraceae bacterium]
MRDKLASLYIKITGSRRLLAGCIAAALLIVICLVTVLTVILSGNSAVPSKLSDFDRKGIRIGVPEGYIFGDSVKRELPKAEAVYFETRDEVYRALAGGMIDAAADDEPIIRAILRSSDIFTLIDGYLEPSDYSLVFPKDEQGELHSRQYSEYIEKLSASGALSALDQKWFGDDPEGRTSEDASLLPAENGLLVFAFDTSNIPFAYLSAGRPVGYDIDLAIGFCREYGYGLSFAQTDFDEMLRGTAAGRYDAGCGAITITREREEFLNFGAADYSGGISLCTAVPVDGGRAPGPFAYIRRSFRNTFLEEGRYKLFFGGLLTTILIVVSAVLIGTPFALLSYIITRRTSFFLRGLLRALIWLLGSIPAIMLIIPIYYRYYRDLAHGGIIAAIIGFSLVFAEDVFRIIVRNGKAVKYTIRFDDITDDLAAAGIDSTETVESAEYAYRLEFIDTKEFFRLLWSENGADIWTDYRDRIISMLKMTSVVGYIAVQDLTKVYDIIRSESYEVLMPLFAVTIAYFLLIRLVTLIFKRLTV